MSKKSLQLKRVQLPKPWKAQTGCWEGVVNHASTEDRIRQACKVSKMSLCWAASKNYQLPTLVPIGCWVKRKFKLCKSRQGISQRAKWKDLTSLKWVSSQHTVRSMLWAIQSMASSVLMHQNLRQKIPQTSMRNRESRTLWLSCQRCAATTSW